MVRKIAIVERKDNPFSSSVPSVGRTPSAWFWVKGQFIFPIFSYSYFIFLYEYSYFKKVQHVELPVPYHTFEQIDTYEFSFNFDPGG